jgi:DNA polymerase V
METVDGINWRWGSDTLRFGAQGNKQDWFMKQRRRSPRYTTRWTEILTIS